MLAASLLLGMVGCVEGTLEVNEPMPVADAGFDQIRFLGDGDTVVVDLDGRGSCDPQRHGVDEVRWSLVDSPLNASPLLSNAGDLRALFEADLPGDYLIGLQVTAEERESPVDYVLVSVREGDGDDVVVLLPEINACGDRIRS